MTIPVVGEHRITPSSVPVVRFKLTSVLGRALEAARAVVDDLDDDQVPASLRKVRAHAGELTPPLAAQLLKEIDRLDWLRERALESWDDADPGSDGPHRASALFLVRPEGWAANLVRLAWEAGSAAGSGASQRGDRAAQALEGELMASREKVKGLQKEIDGLRSEVAAERRAARAPERARRAAEARVEDAARRADEERAARLAERDAAIATLEAEVLRLRDELRASRKELAAASARIEEQGAGSAWVGREPLDLARHLDDLMLQARRGASATADTALAIGAPALPTGVRPDAPEAIDALVRIPGPLGVIVDGYNAGLAMGEGSPAEVRSRLEDLLRRLRTLGGPGMTVTVVWDSALEEPTPRRPDSLDIRFAPPGTPADDVVVAIAAAASRAVVITNDREVRDRAEAGGALALWSDALVAWARRR